MPKEEKKVLKQLADDKHQFFIPFDDFLNLFDEASVSCYQKANVTTSGRLGVRGGRLSALKLQIQKAGVYSVRLS